LRKSGWNFPRLSDINGSLFRRGSNSGTPSLPLASSLEETGGMDAPYRPPFPHNAPIFHSCPRLRSKDLIAPRHQSGMRRVVADARASGSQAAVTLELLAKRRTFPNLIGSPLDDLLAGRDLTSDGNVLANSRSLSHINPVCSTINRRNHERSLSRGYHACRWNKEKILSSTNWPINGGVHARSETSVFVVNIQFDDQVRFPDK
jgi:hypothetical protein